MSSLDEELRGAMEALERTTPDGYFDELPAKIEARLEVQEMAGTEMAAGDDKGQDKLGHPPMQVGDQSEPKKTEENTGLHDIRQLARSQKRRISKRVSTQSDVEESLLSSSASGLNAVVLPVPGKDKPTYDEKEKRSTKSSGKAATATAAASADSDSDDRNKGSVWIFAAVGVAAIAAGAAFFVMRGGNDDGDNKKVAAADTAAPAATGGVAAPPSAAGGDDTPGVAKDDDTAAPTAVKPDETSAKGASETDDSATKAEGPSADDDTASDTAADRKAGTKVAAAKRSRDRGKTKRRKADKPKKTAAKADKPAATKKKADEPKKDGKKKKPKSIDDLLSSAAGITKKDKAKKDPSADKPAKPTKKKLTRGEIQRGMRSVLGRVSGCYNKHKVSGRVTVRVTIAPSGKVAKASPTGKFAGTPTGKCVASAARRARFPAYDGKPTTFPYPFLLSP